MTAAHLVGYLYWQENMSIPEISKEMGISNDRLYGLLHKHNIPLRSRSDVNYTTYKGKPQFKLRENLTAEQEKLKMAGLMLYWGEGAKQGHTVDMVNCDVNTILIFLRFMREICGVAESRLRVFLYVYEGQNIDMITRYWSRQTRIPVAQFIKPYVSPLRRDRPRQRVMSYGVAHVRYSDKRLLDQIKN